MAILFVASALPSFAQTCNFSVNPPLPVCAGRDLTFTAATSPDSNAVYVWTFGDSTANDSGRVVTHAYAIDSVDQNYTVSLTVTDSSGTCDTSYVITALGAPNLELIGITDLCLPNLNCNDPFTSPPFTLTSPGGNLAGMGPFRWNWGDGSPPQDTTATTLGHTFQAFGTYNLTVSAAGAGCPSVRQQIKFYREPDQPLLTLPITDACEGDTVIATVSHNQCPGNEEIYVVYWDFPNLDDVDTLYTPGQVKHVYNFEDARACNTISGSISPQVRVWVINPCFPPDESINASWNATSAQVDVAPHPIFDVPQDPLCWPDDSVFCFNNNSCPNLFLDTLSYVWTFGDTASANNTSTDATPCHTFSGPGVYEITLEATNTGCGTQSSTQTLVIEESPVANFSVDQQTACIPAPFSFTNLSTPNAEVIYDWRVTPDTGYTFVNGSGRDSANVDLLFTVPGDYVIEMAIATPNCGIDSISTMISVLGPPEAGIGLLPDSCGSVLYFPGASLDSNNNPITYIRWDFGPHATPRYSSQLDPGPISFEPDDDSLTQLVSLQVGNSCDTLTVTTSFDLNGAQIVSGGRDTSLCQGAADYCLQASPPGGSWEFGGNVYNSFCFTPSQAGTFNVIYAYDSLGCTFYDTVQIQVLSLPQVTASDIELCLGDSVLLSAQPAGGVFAGTGVFGGNQFTNSIPGTYPITYTIGDTSTGCVNPFTFQATVRDLPLVDAGGFITICISGGPQIIGGASPLGGTWSGNGIIDPASGLFDPNAVGLGSHLVFYEFTDAFGCSSMDSLEVFVIDVAVVNAGPDDSACVSQGSFRLTGQNSSAPGIWSGPGIIDVQLGTFDPAVAGVGTHILSYCVGTGQCQVCDTRLITVLPSPQVTAISDSICLGNGPLSLFDLGRVGGVATAGSWSGPGVSQTGLNYFFDTTALGTYTLTFTYVDQGNGLGCVASANANVSVLSGPQTSFVTPTDICRGIPVSFQNTSSNSISYSWDFGDPANSTSNVPNPIFTYQDTGQFTVTLTSTSAQGCVETFSAQVDVSFAPNPMFTQSLDTACAVMSVIPGMNGVEVLFTDQSFSENASYLWDFGGGIMANGMGTFTGAQPPAVYFAEATGDTTYTITLSLGNSCDTLSVSSTLTVKPLPRAIFSPDFGTFCSPYTPQWANISTGGADTFLWYLEDFSQLLSTDSIPNNIVLTYNGYNDTTYTVIMIAANECGRDTGYQQITVQPRNIDAFFNTSITQGCAPLTVDFTSFAGGTLSFFDFGDGSSFVGDSATHTYFQAGRYDVVHIVANGCSRDTDTVAIFVSAAANLGISPRQAVICPGEPLQLNDTTGIGTSLGYIWSFGNGDSSNANSPVYTYQTPGTYQVIVSAASNNGCIGRDTAYISVRNAPSPSFLPTTDNGCGPLTVAFINQSQNLSNFFWEFGDGNVSTLVSPVHVYNQQGAYQVSFEAYDAFGCKGVAIDSIFVYPKPDANFNILVPDSCGVPVQVSFQNTTTGNATAYSWDLDGGTSTLTDPQRFYSQTGIFNIQLEAISAFGCRDTIEKSFTLYPQPEISLTVDRSEGCSPLAVNLSSGGQNFTTSVLTFGDGSFKVSPAQIESKTYYATNQDSNIKAILTADYQGVCFDTAEVDLEVFANPVAAFDLVADSLCGIPATMSFLNNSTDNEGIPRYDWNFEDPVSGQSNVSILRDPVHTFIAEDVYDVSLITTDTDGCSDTIQKPVSVFEQAVANIVQDESLGCFPLGVNFQSFQPDLATEWKWTFGNGKQSNDPTASIDFVYADTFDISLVVNNKRVCFDTARSQVVVGAPPRANFELETFGNCNDSLTVISSNNSQNADNYLWQFAGWGNSSEFEPIVTYTVGAEYPVELIASNVYGCEDTASDVITYLGSLAGFSLEQEGLCSPSVVKFTDESREAASWEWDFGDGTPPSFERNPTHVYTEGGFYTVRQIVTFQGFCKDTFYFPTPIEVRNSPMAEAGFDQLNPENEGHIQFYDRSAKPGDRIRWDFGDGRVSFENNPMHTYTENPSLICDCNAPNLLGGTQNREDSLFYQVFQTQINENGCTATDTLLIHPHIHGLYVPDAIIPDGEAPNNQFMVQAFGMCDLHIAVYNHWGNKVWEWNSEADGNGFDEQGRPVGGWDGTIKGLEIDRNVLVWRLHRVKFTGCKRYTGPTQGTLTIIR
ncbi:MAG: PKD domain-containing protein [Bacteroidia bacterium]|nr:PKD domain-containing protein [Bacteroidia bacterium]